MSTKQDTRQLFANSIMELMLKKSLDDISVQELTEYCKLSRRTFYNNFNDKYALIDWIYKTQAVDYIKLVGEECSWRNAVMCKLSIIQKNPSFYKKVYRQEWFLTSFQDITKQLYIDLIAKNSPTGLTPELKFAIEFYCNACVKATSNWVLGGLNETPEELTESFLTCVPNVIKKYLQ